MSVESAISKASEEFNKALDHLKFEFGHLQVGRASSGLVENISVDVYGVAQPIKNIANISIPDPRTIQIQPWDKSNLVPIEKAIVGIGTGLNPMNDGNFIRVPIPALTEERRKDVVKQVWKLAEDARIAVRGSRQDAHNHFKHLKAESEITEDDWHSADKDLQKRVDEANDKIAEIAKSKEDDVMKI